MIWDSLLAQITATVGSNKDVVLNADATKVLISLQKIEVEEFCTMAFAPPLVDESRNKVNARLIGHDKAFLQTTSATEAICSKLVEVRTHLVVEANISLSQAFHVVNIHAHHVT